MLLQMNLPVVNDTTFERIMDVRINHGESFRSFRINLEAKLKELRIIKDPEELALAIQNVEHELAEVEIADIKKEFSKIKHHAFGEAAVLTAGVATSVISAGWSFIAAACALAQGYKTYTEYKTSIVQSPGFFYWQLQK